MFHCDLLGACGCGCAPCGACGGWGVGAHVRPGHGAESRVDAAGLVALVVSLLRRRRQVPDEDASQRYFARHVTECCAVAATVVEDGVNDPWVDARREGPGPAFLATQSAAELPPALCFPPHSIATGGPGRQQQAIPPRHEQTRPPTNSIPLRAIGAPGVWVSFGDLSIRMK